MGIKNLTEAEEKRVLQACWEDKRRRTRKETGCKGKETTVWGYDLLH